MKTLWDFLGKRSKFFHVFASILTVVAIAYVDYVTGPEVSLSIFYVIPIGLAVWFVGRWFGLVTSMLSAYAWLAAELASRLTSSHAATPYWNASVRLAVFWVIAWLLDQLRSLQSNLEEIVRQRTASLDEEIARREKLEQELIESTDKERERIGRDLHDGLGQLLAAAAATSLSMEEKLAKQHVENSEAKKITQIVKLAIAESRLLAKGLYPAALELGGLSSALEQLCSSVSTDFGIDCRLVGERTVVVQDRRVAEQLFRIAQEAVNNAVKHAKPKHIVVGLTTNDQSTVLIVNDNGIAQSQPSTSGGMGLHIMAYRAKLIGASLVIEQDPDGGTLVTCTVEPLTPSGKHEVKELGHDASA